MSRRILKPAVARWLLVGSTLAVALLSSVQAALAAGPRAAPLPGGPMFLCVPEGERVVVTAARERGALPRWARERGSSLVSTTLRSSAGMKAAADGRFTLRWAGRTLACEPTHED